MPNNVFSNINKALYYLENDDCVQFEMFYDKHSFNYVGDYPRFFKHALDNKSVKCVRFLFSKPAALYNIPFSYMIDSFMLTKDQYIFDEIIKIDANIVNRLFFKKLVETNDFVYLKKLVENYYNYSVITGTIRKNIINKEILHFLADLTNFNFMLSDSKSKRKKFIDNYDVISKLTYKEKSLYLKSL